ncbi:tetratricopeptide repeat protein [Streptomyces sp. NPDC002054]|uniref:tetratricopeptide repeat protein n=1 Tax=Streptomyces sp. NPDC002054 TaxID=3154663 RepID=UPI00331AE625
MGMNEVQHGRADARSEVAVAYLALSEGELGHAARHLGSAFAAEPGLPEAHEALAELAAAAGGALAALEWFPTDEASSGIVACMAHLYAAAGFWDAAVDRLGAVIGAEPERGWAQVAWLARPDLAGLVSPEAVGRAVAAVTGGLPEGPAPAGLREAVGPFRGLVGAVLERHPEHTALLTLASVLARRLGEPDEAARWAEQALAVCQAEIARDPSDLERYVDVAEVYQRTGRPAEGLPWLDRVLDIDPGHPTAGPAVHALRHAAEGGGTEHLLALSDHLREYPDHGYAGHLLAELCDGVPWLGHVHPASEASLGVLHRILADPGTAPGSGIELVGSHLEPPSTVLAVRMGLPRSGIAYKCVPLPDPRLPQHEVGTRLWEFDGPAARPALDPPSRPAAELVRQVASVGWDAPGAAYDHAVRLSGLSLGDLLAVCVHPPLPRDSAQGAYLLGRQPELWVRAVQTFACLGIAHHHADEPWAGSRRRAVLIDLLFGPEDWVNEAAGFALLATAWADPAAREEVGALLTDRMTAVGRAWQERDATILASLCRLVLGCPWVERGVREVAARMLAAVTRYET